LTNTERLGKYHLSANDNNDRYFQGYSAVNNPVEEIEARKSWEDYLDFYQYKFFKFFDAKKFESPLIVISVLPLE
jgi:hypothetical protein